MTDSAGANLIPCVGVLVESDAAAGPPDRKDDLLV
jgi:hypothetical protein